MRAYGGRLKDDMSLPLQSKGEMEVEESMCDDHVLLRDRWVTYIVGLDRLPLSCEFIHHRYCLNS